MASDRGYFITLEGCEGSGKSTQLALLNDYFKDNNIDVVFTREPGGTPIAEDIRKIILDVKNIDMTDQTEALLYASARAQHISEKILPAVKAGKIVICDRYIDSSFAYQAYARGLGYDFVSGINAFAIKNCMPDLTIFYDISPREAFLRKGGADEGDRVEQSGIAFHERVYGGYISLTEKFPDRIVKIDARKSKEEIFDETVGILKRRGIII